MADLAVVKNRLRMRMFRFDNGLRASCDCDQGAVTYMCKDCAALFCRACADAHQCHVRQLRTVLRTSGA